ncbi:DUF6212 domain-containing protein [Sphingomonas sp.]|uniref:DUF6212 domain-containing protein n=1 Tax=Sphingomonas sp. TaxID=28214 RepID=UPI003D6CCC21
MVAVQARESEAPSASWPIDLEALPPGWLQLSLVSAGGSSTSTAAMVLSGSLALSESRIGTRSPSTGVFFWPPLNTPQALSARRAAIASGTLFPVIMVLSFPQVFRPRPHPIRPPSEPRVDARWRERFLRGRSG